MLLRSFREQLLSSGYLTFNLVGGSMNPMNTGRNLRGNLGGGDIVPKGYKKGQLAQFTPEQNQLFQSMFPHLQQGGWLSGLASGDQSAFDEMEAPAFRQFNDLMGGLASKFSAGSGGQSLGLGKSSGFRNAQTAATSNFAQDLASKRQDLKRQALMDLFGMSSSLLGQRPYDKFLVEKPQSDFWSQIGLGVGKGIPGAASGALFGSSGGPGGAAAGGLLGFLSSMFNKK